MKPDFTSAIRREIAKLLVLARINEDRESSKLDDEIYYFYPKDFGTAFKSLGWDDGCCLEVEVRWTHRAKLNEG